MVLFHMPGFSRNGAFIKMPGQRLLMSWYSPIGALSSSVARNFTRSISAARQWAESIDTIVACLGIWLAVTASPEVHCVSDRPVVDPGSRRKSSDLCHIFNICEDNAWIGGGGEGKPWGVGMGLKILHLAFLDSHSNLHTSSIPFTKESRIYG